MQPNAVINRCAAILAEAHIEDQAITATNFLDYAEIVRDVVLSWDDEKQRRTWVVEFLEGLRALRDDYARIVERDPLCIYKPAHEVSLAFHKSLAFIRYYRAGNRSSKTESGRGDNYWVVTGQHPFRELPPLPAAIFIIGSSYSQYAPAVFEKKYLLGEPGNPLTPAFPEGGAWLHHYDQKKHIIYIACPACKERGTPTACNHGLSTIQLFTDQGSVMSLAGGQYVQGQFDEHVQEKFFTEAIKRLETVPFSSLMVTHTPLEGKGAWEHQRLTQRFEQGGLENLVPGSDRPWCEVFSIDQFAAGLSPPDLIRANMASMHPAEVESRIFGRPASFTEQGVFDAITLAEMYDEVKDGERFLLSTHSPYEGTDEQVLTNGGWERAQIKLERDPNAKLIIWEPPKKGAVYLIGADVAQGLTHGDASCAQVMRIDRTGFTFDLEQVAEYHGAINSYNYGYELIKLSMLYHNAIIVPERRGPGDATIQCIKAAAYPHLFLDVSDPSQRQPGMDSLFGIDTNIKTKGVIISILQNALRDQVTGRRRLVIRSYMTLEELSQYGQELTESGLSYRFRGTGGSHDDRVMALAMAVYAILTYTHLYDIGDEQRKRKQIDQKLQTEIGRFWADVHKDIERTTNHFLEDV